MNKLKDIGILPNQTKYKKPTGNNTGLEATPSNLLDLIQEAIDDGSLAINGSGSGNSQVQVDWNINDTNDIRYILNKPTYLNTNIGNSNLTLSDNRIISGANKDLTFENISTYILRGAGLYFYSDNLNQRMYLDDNTFFAGNNTGVNNQIIFYKDYNTNTKASIIRSPSFTIEANEYLTKTDNTTFGSSVSFINKTKTSLYHEIYNTYSPTNGFSNLSSRIGFSRVDPTNTKFELNINGNTSKLQGHVLTLVNPTTGEANWQPITSNGNQNLGNTNLTLSSDRTVTGSNRSLDFIGLNQYNINSQQLNIYSDLTRFYPDELRIVIDGNGGVSNGNVLTITDANTGKSEWKPIPTAINYSYQEQLTGVNWVDARPIWQITVSLSSNGTTVVSGINGTIAQVISFEGFNNPSGNIVTPIQGQNNIGYMYSMDPATKTITGPYSPSIITIKYTKI
jgi:hypothetical protein